MGNKMSHVANASDETIYGKCQDNPTKVDFDVGVNTPKGGVTFGFKDKTPVVPPGFVAIASKDFIAFPSSHPYLSIKSASGTIVCENYHPGDDISVIVKPDLTLARAQYGQVWVARGGRVYGEIRR